MVIENIKRYYSKMYAAEKKVATYILDHATEVISMSVSELAERTGTSDATIIRMCKRIEYSGFYQMKINLASECGQQQLLISSQPNDIFEFFDEISKSIAKAARNINMDVLQICIDLISNARTVYFVAWGNTETIADDFAHRLSRIGIQTFVSPIPEYTIRSINLGTKEDVLIAISHSGTSIQVIQSIELAKKLGIKTILITNTKDSEASAITDFSLCTDSKDTVFYDLGGASHVLEMTLVDAILYFMTKNITQMNKGDAAEMLLSQYKL